MEDAMTMAELNQFYDCAIPERATALATGRSIDRERAHAQIRWLARQVEFHTLAAAEWQQRGDVARAQSNREDAELMERQRAEWVAYAARLAP
jgi:hypothetical protein